MVSPENTPLTNAFMAETRANGCARASGIRIKTIVRGSEGRRLVTRAVIILMSVDSDAHAPRRLIALPADVETFKRSIAYRDLVGFILTLNEAVRDSEIPDEGDEVDEAMAATAAAANGDVTPPQTSAHVRALVVWLDELTAAVADVPLEKSQPGRFGNVAFRTWLTRAQVASRAFLSGALNLSAPHAAELQAYVDESFGNKTRIDYGTGHELNFVAFLCCLSKLGLLGRSDARAIVVLVFNRYLALMRRLQTYFVLEPAGSRGVWGLDDFQFLPFLWGSSQLLGACRQSVLILCLSFCMHTHGVAYTACAARAACINSISHVS